MAEENHENLIMVRFRTRLESGSDFTSIGSLYIVTSLSLQPFKQRLISYFFQDYDILLFSILSVKCTNNLGSGFMNHFEREIYDTKFPTHISFPCSISYLSYHSNFYFDAQNLTFIRDYSHVITLPVSCLLQE
jgi:hypothetical protein